MNGPDGCGSTVGPRRHADTSWRGSVRVEGDTTSISQIAVRRVRTLHRGLDRGGSMITIRSTLAADESTLRFARSLKTPRRPRSVTPSAPGVSSNSLSLRNRSAVAGYCAGARSWQTSRVYRTRACDAGRSSLHVVSGRWLARKCRPKKAEPGRRGNDSRAPR